MIPSLLWTSLILLQPLWKSKAAEIPVFGWFSILPQISSKFTICPLNYIYFMNYIGAHVIICYSDTSWIFNAL